MPDYTVSADVDSMLRSANDAAIRSAIGVGQTDAPTFLALTAGTGLAKLEYTAANGLTLKRSSDGAQSITINAEANSISAGSFVANNGTIKNGPNTTTLELGTSGIVEQRNGSSPQAFRVANQVGALPLTDYDRAVFDFKTTLNTLRIGTENSGTTGYTTARPIDFVTGGVVRMSIAAAGGVTVAANLNVNDFVATTDISAGVYIMWGGGARSRMASPSTGLITLYNSGATDFGRLQLGGTTDAFPSIARDGAGVKFTGAAAGSTSWIKVPAVAVASLPAAATAGAGARSFVNDALTPVFGSAVTGGGAVTVPVYSTGSAWNVG